MKTTVSKLVHFALATAFVAFGTAAAANAQTTANNRTVMTFSQPVEVPGKILPAGTYTFELHDSGMNRHVIQIFDEGGTKLQAMVLAVPSYRAKPTDDTVVRFDEVAPGQPQAIRIWYYPGQTTGNELVYSNTRARELAAAGNTAVQSTDDATYADTKLDTLGNAQVTAVDANAADRNSANSTAATSQTPVTQPTTPPTPQTQPTTPAPMTQPTTPQTQPATPMTQPTTPQTQPTDPTRPDPARTEPTRMDGTTPANPDRSMTDRDELPDTASSLPLVMLIGAGLLAIGVTLRSMKANPSH